MVCLDSNPGQQDGRRIRIHWAMVAPHHCFSTVETAPETLISLYKSPLPRRLVMRQVKVARRNVIEWNVGGRDDVISVRRCSVRVRRSTQFAKSGSRWVRQNVNSCITNLEFVFVYLILSLSLSLSLVVFLFFFVFASLGSQLVSLFIPR